MDIKPDPKLPVVKTQASSPRFDAEGMHQGLLSRTCRCVGEPFATLNFAEFVFHALR